jgi:salicylate hydroxylase
MRRRVAGSATPKPTGRSAWRALIPVDNAPEPLRASRVGLWLGEAAHLVTYPVARGSAINIVAIVEETWDRPGWSAAGDGAWLAARFAGWSRAARDVIAAPFSWQKWAIVSIDPALPWVEGPVGLIGDAAHAMSPFVAQGAAMAMEDAAVLAQCLGRTSDFAAGLRAYEAARKPRILEVATAAVRTGEVYHWRYPRALFRELALGLLGARLVFWQNDWIYRWEPT